MGRITPPTEAADESQAQVPDQEVQPQLSSSSSLAILTLTVRVITLLSLILTISLLASNSTTVRTSIDDSNSDYDNNSIQVTVHFNDVYAYRYALATAVIGTAYTLVQLPFSIHQVTYGKRLNLHINHATLMVYEFLGDKVVLSLVATGLGAIFGATVDLKTNLDTLDDAVEKYIGDSGSTFSLIRAKLDDFFSRAYIPAIFLLIAFIACGLSSILSSLALTKKTR